MAELSFRELQQLAEAMYTIEDTRRDLGRLVEYFKTMPYYDMAIDEAFCRERKLRRETAIEHDVFFVNEDTIAGLLPEEYRAESLGFIKNGYILQMGRLVYPVKDVRGQVMGFCGWDPFVKPKYLDSQNHGYHAKRTTLFGMEKLPEYYSNNKPVFVNEGIVDTLYLRENGFQALSTLTAGMSKYVIYILRRFGNRLFIVPDNDDAGNTYVKQAKRMLPKANVIQPTMGKDIDGFRKLEDGKYEEQVLNDLRSLCACPYLPVKSFITR